MLNNCFLLLNVEAVPVGKCVRRVKNDEKTSGIPAKNAT